MITKPLSLHLFDIPTVKVENISKSPWTTGSNMWNALPKELRDIHILTELKIKLKLYLYVYQLTLLVNAFWWYFLCLPWWLSCLNCQMFSRDFVNGIYTIHSSFFILIELECKTTFRIMILRSVAAI